jgi:thioredoxin-like negative regulator of GroEL
MKPIYDLAITLSERVPQLVMFTAPWCGPCKQVKPAVHALQTAYGFPLVEIDVDTLSPAQRSELGIRAVPTVRVLSGGASLAQFSGLRSQAQIKEWLLGHNLISDGLDFE